MSRPLDTRLLWAGGSAWAGAALGLWAGEWAVLGLGLGLGLLALAVRLRRSARAAPGPDDASGSAVAVLVLLCVSAALVACASGALRAGATTRGPVAELAEERAVVAVHLRVVSDPDLREGRYAAEVLFRARVEQVSGRGRTGVVRGVPVLVSATPAWQGLRLGSLVEATGRLSPTTDRRFSAVLDASGLPVLRQRPPWPLRAADRVREAVRRSAGAGPGESPGLVPALVTGDVSGLDADLEDDFRTAGLTHLTAVSGTNLTLLLASALWVAKMLGARGRGRTVVGLACVAGFVLVARPEPSVVRAAAMGLVALAGLGWAGRGTTDGPATGRSRGVRALGAAVLLLTTLDPWLSLSPGFALSTLATGGILLLAPALVRALEAWLPRGAAMAVAVPLAAQLACTPVVAALSGAVSLVAVAANLLVAPLVAPATVLGLVAGLADLAWRPAGALLGWAAGVSAQGIVEVARASAALPAASVDWPADGWGLALLTLLTVLAAACGPWVLRRRPLAVALAAALAVAVARPAPVLPTPGWPPPRWLVVACDVGQGDALVLAAGPHEAVVVDAGPDPDLVDACLRRLDVRRVPALVLTHFHADHVDGMPGVLSGRPVGEVVVSGMAEPEAGARRVRAWARAAGVPVRVPAYGEVATAGAARWRVWSHQDRVTDGPNDASVVVLVESRGVRILLTGDVEPSAQSLLAREGVGPVDVLKVPHHGSSYQDEDWLRSLGPRVALVSVGADNDYGHPSEGVLRLLRGVGAVVGRTDLHGDLAVVGRGSDLVLATRSG